MNQNNKKEKSDHANDLNEAIEKLQKAINTAKYEIENAGAYLSNKDIGELYAAYSQEDDGIHISNMHGNVEFEDGWTVSFPYLAKELWNHADRDQERNLIAGIRTMLELMEKWQARLPDESPDNE